MNGPPQPWRCDPDAPRDLFTIMAVCTAGHVELLWRTEPHALITSKRGRSMRADDAIWTCERRMFDVPVSGGTVAFAPCERTLRPVDEPWAIAAYLVGGQEAVEAAYQERAQAQQRTR